jgi:hypothetical protein
MRRFTFFLVAFATTAGFVALVGPVPVPGHADGESSPYVTVIPNGHRDRQWISSAHEAGNLNSLGAVLGDDVAIKASRAGRLRSRTARSLLLCVTVTSRRRKTTKSLARLNLSFPAIPRTFSSWSRTRPSTRQRAAGDSVTSRTANLVTRRL